MDMMNMTMVNSTMHMTMQMSFKWGKNVTILFRNWPGNDNIGMYILALVFVFVIAFAMEALSVWPSVKTASSTSPIAAGLTQASVYAVRITLGYFVMLAVMSFNVGVFIVAVAGHTVGFFVAKTSALSMTTKTPEPEPSF